MRIALKYLFHKKVVLNIFIAYFTLNRSWNIVMSNLIIIKNNELYVGTWRLSKGFGVDHRYLKRTVEKYKNEFEEFGFKVVHNSESGTKKKGGQVEEYILNEPQATYLTMLMKNTEEVRKF